MSRETTLAFRRERNKGGGGKKGGAFTPIINEKKGEKMEGKYDLISFDSIRRKKREKETPFIRR